MSDKKQEWPDFNKLMEKFQKGQEKIAQSKIVQSGKKMIDDAVKSDQAKSIVDQVKSVADDLIGAAERQNKEGVRPEKPFSNLEDLEKSAADFEKNMKKTMDALRPGSSSSSSSVSDLPSGGFESIYASLKNTLGRRLSDPSSPSPEPFENPAPTAPVEKAQKASLEKQQSPTTHATPDFSPPADLVDQIKQIVVGLGHDLPVSATSALEWDGLTNAARSAWVSVVTQGRLSEPQVGLVFAQWTDFLADLSSRAASWPAPHEMWAGWARERSAEADKISPWVVQSEKSPWVVPVTHRGAGLSPKAPEGVPSALSKDLSNACDFYAWAQDQSSLRWKNTPAAASLNELQSRLDEFEPTTPEQDKWKQAALDRCTIIDAKLTAKTALSKDPAVPVQPGRPAVKKKSR